MFSACYCTSTFIISFFIVSVVFIIFVPDACFSELKFLFGFISLSEFLSLTTVM